MAKVTKSNIVAGLKKMGALLDLNAEVQSAIDYTVESFEENPRNVTAEDLKETITQIETGTGKKFSDLINEVKEINNAKKDSEVKGEVITPVETKEKKKVVKKAPSKVENAEKKTSKVIIPKKTEEAKVEAPKEEKEEVKPVTPKVEAEVKKATKKEKVETLENFPEKIVSKALKGTLKLRTDLKTIKDVVEAWNKEEDLVIATYWTKKHLRQYASSYDPMGINPNSPKSFEHDLDLIEITYANELVVTGNSLYSFIPQILLPKDFEQDEDNLRYANGVEFQVYEVISE